MKRGGGLLWIVVLLVLLAGGGTVAVKKVVQLTEERRKVRDALRAAGARYAAAGKLSAEAPDWIEAIGRVETGLRLGRVNRSGPDGARGGSWGPTQISEKTARAHGYLGAMEAINSDASVAAEWTARILAAAHPRNFAEAVAAWNAGRYGADKDRDGVLDPGEAPEITVTDYWPKALAALEQARAA
jgi:hypothetical protein